MRFALLALLSASLLPGFQAQRRTFVYDPQGRPQLWSAESSGDRRSTSTGRDMNGRETRVEEVDENVVRDSGGVKIVERTIRRFDPNGRPLPPEREIVESTQLPGGAVSTSTTLYQAGLNGRLQPARRTTEQTVTSAGVTRTETRIERANLNGAFAAAEQRIAEQRTTGAATETRETTLLPDTNGRFQEAARRIVTATQANGATREQVDEYESASTGKLQLSRQSIARVEKDPSGAERRVVDVFGPAAPGRPIETGTLALRERQIIELRPTPLGSVETFSIQRPELRGRGQLGDVVKISETVCTGKCIAPSAPPPPPGEVKK